MKDVFNIVMTTSIYGAIVGLILLFMKSLLRNKLNAKWHCFIWIILILKLLVPFGPESAYSLFNAVPEVNYSSISKFDNITAYFNQEDITTNHVLPSELSPSDGINQVKPISLRENILPYIWAIGALLMLFWLIASYLGLYRRLQMNSTAPDERILKIYEVCKAKIDVGRNIPILMQKAVGMPSLFGVFKPQILLSSTVEKLSDKELEYILMHELAHYKRKDIFVNYLLLALQIVHWFNPVLWFCFKQIRLDMELATDELVLSKLQDTEHRDYGRALIAILEGFSTPKLAPRLLAMADDKKNIEKRIKMIKMADVFKSKRKLVIIVGLLCIALLSTLLLTNGIKREPAAINITPYNAEELIKYKTPYVGDNSKAVNLLGSLPYGEFLKGTALQTQIAPYVIEAEYTFGNMEFDRELLKARLSNNAAVVFSLIENVEVVVYQLDIGRGVSTYEFIRPEFEKVYGASIWDFSKDVKTFEKFLESLIFKVGTFPEKYALTMSSTPGIQLTTFYYGDADISKVSYATERGILFTWDVSTGKISEGKQALDLTYGIEAYWSPISDNNSELSKEDNIVTITLIDNKGKNIGKKQIVIGSDGGFYYIVKPSLGVIPGFNKSQQKPVRSMEEIISLAIKARSSAYREGEAATEGHVILGVEEYGPKIKVYTMAGFGAFGFENGVFTKISGSGAIPTVITLAKSTEGHHGLLEYKEAQGGGGYTDSVKKMFPANLHNEALNTSKYSSELINQQELQAAAYLNSIGRVAKVTANHVDKVLVNINVDASNKLFSELGKYDAFINTCPYWIGTVEQIENSIRYVYETSQSKTNDGFDLIIFKKSDSAERIIKEVKYKIVGSEPQLVK